MNPPTEDWRKYHSQGWCPMPAEVQGHLLPCVHGDGHVGECQPSATALRRHLARGSRACEEHNCPVVRR